MRKRQAYNFRQKHIHASAFDHGHLEMKVGKLALYVFSFSLFIYVS